MTDNEMSDEQVEKYLIALRKAHPKPLNINDADRRELEKCGIVEPTGFGDKVNLNDFGLEIADNGGWLKYVAEQTASYNEQQELDRVSKKKIRDDAKLSSWQVKAFWWTFGLGIWGSITGTVALSLELQDRYYKWQKSKEKEQEVSPTSTLPLPKTDSSATDTPQIKNDTTK